MEYYFKTVCLPLILGCLPLAVNYYLRRREEKLQVASRRRYLAVRIASYFEETILWAQDCQDDWASYLIDGGDIPQTSFPSISYDEFDDVDWTVLDVELLNEILSLKNFTLLLLRIADFEEEVAKDSAQAVLVRLLMLRNFAGKAWTLAKTLRELAGLPIPDSSYYEKVLASMLETYKRKNSLYENGWINFEENSA